MARPIVLSNGTLHVGINNYGLVHDLYFPHVGMENHSAGKDLRHKVGVWIDGRISWLDDGSWDITFRTASAALIGHTKAKHKELQVILEFTDFVDANDNLFMRNVHVINQAGNPREVRLFFHQAFVIGDSRSNTDTAQYIPDSHAILHYRGRRALVIGGRGSNGDPFDQRSIGLFGIENREGTWRDAEDGELANGTVEHGRVDSTIRFVETIEGHGSTHVEYWVSVGETIRDALSLHKDTLEKRDSFARHEQATTSWWHTWLEPTMRIATKLPAEFREQFVKSAMVIRSHIDDGGAVIASADTAMLNYSRDAYGYCWPRDGAHVLWPLIRLGYTDEPRKFFEFMRKGLHSKGYLMHKYWADGSLGPSWHPYKEIDGLTTPPIQEDETAGVLFAYAQFYHVNPEAANLMSFYPTFVKPMADFMARFVDPATNLPRPSYDLWEEVFLTSTYTTALTHAALLAAAELAEIQQDQDSAVRWRSTANDMLEAAGKYLHHKENNTLRKGILIENGTVNVNNTIDASSFYGAFMYGLFPTNGEELSGMLQAMQQQLRGSNPNEGLQRYEFDNYRRKSSDAKANPWIICSLWEAQYAVEQGDINRAHEILRWVQSLASSTGMFAEQVDPDTHQPVSVEPLVWSHAEWMSTLLDSTVENTQEQ